MRNENGRDAGLVLHFLDLLAGLQAKPRVQVGQRFVQQEHLGHLDQRAGDGDPLLLTAGQLTGFPVPVVPDLHQPHGRFRFLQHLLLGEFVLSLQILQREQDVLQNGQVRIQRVILKDQPDAALLRRHLGHVLFSEQHLPFRRREQPADQV